MRLLASIATLTALATLSSAQPTAGNCPVFPADSIWNTRVDQLPVHPSSSTWVNTIGPSKPVHPDFGSGTYGGGPIGIPFILVPGSQTKYPATFTYQDESDTGPYAIPLNAPIEGGSASTGDRHAIAVDTDNCVLYEIYDAHPQSASWKGGSGAIYHLQSHALRPATWTSADAAGLPIFVGLVRYDEVASGEIRHAIRFTVPQTQKSYVWPARHYASSLTGVQYPPMGARFRLKASFDISHFSATNQIILTALKRYGMILADNGSSWYLSGAPDERWSNDDLHALTGITGSNFEAVDASALMVDPNSDQARQTSVSVTVSPASASVAVNATRQFSATVNGDSNQQVTWDVNGSIGGNSSVGFIDSISGLYTAPSIAPSPATVTVHATSKSMPSAIGSASVTVTNPTPPVSVTVSPASASVQVGQTRQFTATVQNAANTVTWMVNGIVGGNPAVGSITANGLYIAPSIAPSPAIVTIQAASTVQPSAIGSASVNIASPAPISVTVSPSSASVQVGQTRQFSATVQNAVNSVVWMVNGFIGGNAAVGTITSNGSYTAPLVAPSPATVTVQAASTAVASATGSATVSITTPTPLSVAISPSSASVRLGHTHQFSATVQNAAVTSVMWKVNGIQGGNSTVGTISLTGLYTAPKTMPPSSTVSVSAVSTADPSRSASATVNLTVGPRRPGR